MNNPLNGLKDSIVELAQSISEIKDGIGAIAKGIKWALNNPGDCFLLLLRWVFNFLGEIALPMAIVISTISLLFMAGGSVKARKWVYWSIVGFFLIRLLEVFFNVIPIK